MELKTTLSGQTVNNVVREVGINANYWYAISGSKDVKLKRILPVQLWEQVILLFRDRQNCIQAVDNGGKMHSYPVQEKYGIIWVFPGNPVLAEHQSLPKIPEYDDPNYLKLCVSAHFNAHFSICNENAMDVFHGYRHQNLQGWFDPALIKLRQTDDSVTADYQVSYNNLIAKLLGSSNGKVTKKVMTVSFRYPHLVNRLEDSSILYLMRVPVGKTESRSLSLLFLKSPVPQWLSYILRPVLQPVIVHLLFLRSLKQDIEMIESEQENYLKNPQRRYVEVNPAIHAMQRLTIRQYEQYLQSRKASV
ncbi:hypothetical protein [Leptolyngbya sp. NIES-2104]|uniref:hypothetical protein n=1 Tax=Leptolyngbya sp. NIES-2104 TaxID=1552121 RepID=UPI0006EC9E5D|nr:hypothetical protein [Leptolyngbya sp. NIES-2104]GAP94102.1 hypothetical protein NIES2104_06120 [Leptolyngbya sp. NIES-2104]